MKLQPRLVKSKMLLCFGERVEVEGGKCLQAELGRKELNVEEWVNVGLAIHQYFDEVGRKYNWRISHMQSGRSILKHMRNKEKAMEYLMRVREIRKDWTLTEQQFQLLSNRSKITEALRGLQQEISGVRR